MARLDLTEEEVIELTHEFEDQNGHINLEHLRNRLESMTGIDRVQQNPVEENRYTNAQPEPVGVFEAEALQEEVHRLIDVLQLPEDEIHRLVA